MIAKYMRLLLLANLQILIIVTACILLALVLDSFFIFFVSDTLSFLFSLSVATILCLRLATHYWGIRLDEIIELVSSDDGDTPNNSVPPNEPSSTSGEPVATATVTPSDEQGASDNGTATTGSQHLVEDESNHNNFTIGWMHYSGALLTALVALSLIFFVGGGNDLNILATDFQLAPGNINENNYLPSLLLQDEITHFFYARDAFEAIEWWSITFNLGEFVQLALDEWGRPGNTLSYAFFSTFGFMIRRWFAVLLLLLTTIETIMIVRALAGPGRKGLVFYLFTLIVPPLMLWLQPWFFYYGAQSLSQVPFMFFLTMAVSAWLQGKRTRASVFFSLLPITRHEALPLLLIWLVLLHRTTLLSALRNLVVELTAPEDREEENWRESKSALIKWREVIITLLPYAIWNIASLAYRNDAPFRTIFTAVGEEAYEAQNAALFFLATREWMGPLIFILFASSLLVGAIYGWVLLQHWRYRFSQSKHDVSKKIQQLLFSEEQGKSHNHIQRYLWWIFYLAFFLIHVVIIIGPGNPFASGGYDFFVLPIAPAIAVLSTLCIAWLAGPQIREAPSSMQATDTSEDINNSEQHPTGKATNPYLGDLNDAFKFFRSNRSDQQVDDREPPNDNGTYQSGENSNNNTTDSQKRYPIAGIFANPIARPLLLIVLTSLLFLYPTWEDRGIWFGENNITPLLLVTISELLPDGELVETLDGPVRQDAAERRAMGQHVETIIEAVDTATSETTDDWLTPHLETDSNFIPFIITANPTVRYALEQAAEARPDENGVLRLDNGNTPVRLCPRDLWNIDPLVPFYPNLFPPETVIILDGQPDVSIRSNYMLVPEFNEGYNLSLHHLTTAIATEQYMPYFGNWQDEAKFGILDDNVNPNDPIRLINTGESFPRFWQNYGLQIYRQGLEDSVGNAAPPNDEMTQLLRQQAYADRYCGYSDDRRLVEVTAHYHPIYPEFGNLFLSSRDALSSLEVPGNAIRPTLDCPIEQALVDISECAIEIVDIALVGNDDDELQIVSDEALDRLTDVAMNAFFLPPNSLLPVLGCQQITNRLQASWCLVAFGDTAFAIDAESELSYTSNTILATDGDTPPNLVCDYDRESTTPGTLDELIILQDVQGTPLIRPLPEQPSEIADDPAWRERADGIYVQERDDGLLYAEYPARYIPDLRWSEYTTQERMQARAEATIIMPGCFGWVLVDRRGDTSNERGGNALLIGEDLNDLRSDVDNSIVATPN